MRMPSLMASKAALVDGAGGAGGFGRVQEAQQRRAGEDHGERVGDVLALRAGAVPCGASVITTFGSKLSSKEMRIDSEPAIDP